MPAPTIKVEITPSLKRTARRFRGGTTMLHQLEGDATLDLVFFAKQALLTELGASFGKQYKGMGPSSAGYGLHPLSLADSEGRLPAARNAPRRGQSLSKSIEIRKRGRRRAEIGFYGDAAQQAIIRDRGGLRGQEVTDKMRKFYIWMFKEGFVDAPLKKSTKRLARLPATMFFRKAEATVRKEQARLQKLIGDLLLTFLATGTRRRIK